MNDATTTTLDCPNCGADPLFTSDEDGLFYEDTDAVCPECAALCVIGVDDDRAYVRYDGEHADVGQPKCNGSCGAIAEYIGQPGDTYDCERCKLRPADGAAATQEGTEP